MDEKLKKILRNRFYHIKERCEDMNCKCYPRYGGRGIKCLRKNSESFITDMYESFEKHVKEYGIKETTIDRINNSGNYYKENCRRATQKEQAKNRRECRQFEYDGKKFETLRDLSKYVGIHEDIIRYRLNAGRNFERAITQKVRDRKIRLTYKGVQYESLSELCRSIGKKRKVVYDRLQRGRSLEDAINIPKKYFNNYNTKCTNSQT